MTLPKNWSSEVLLDPDLVVVLRAVARAPLSTATVIGSRSSCLVRSKLPWLVHRGYVRQHANHQCDGQLLVEYSLSTKGERALREAGDAPIGTPVIEAMVEASVAAHRMPISEPTPYDGAELRPYAGRAGALDAFTYPSLVAGHLHHPRGTITPV